MMAIQPVPQTLAVAPDVALFDLDHPNGVEAYLVARGLVTPDEVPITLTRAGAGNMNLTLRVTTRRRSIIVKQGRPWVEKYPHIAAPWDRTVVEGRFYRTVAMRPRVAIRLPELLLLDEPNRVLVLEDLGPARDWSTIYESGVTPAELEALLDWLDQLSRVPVPDHEMPLFANRAMRELNHEHIFRLPLVEDNGLDLESITIGLGRLARELQRDDAYCKTVTTLGSQYMADGPALVHGDYFPGSWIDTTDGMRVIDPEFCFLGVREFDYGVMLAHLALARCPRACSDSVFTAASAAGLNDTLVAAFAGVEIMRRLLGVAQLPLPYGLEVKGRLLALSADLVLAGTRNLGRW